MKIISWKTIVEGLQSQETNFPWKWSQVKLRLSVKKIELFREKLSWKGFTLQRRISSVKMEAEKATFEREKIELFRENGGENDSWLYRRTIWRKKIEGNVRLVWIWSSKAC